VYFCWEIYWSNFLCCRARTSSRFAGNLLAPPGEACPLVKNHCFSTMRFIAFC